jgi:hypothetical protein
MDIYYDITNEQLEHNARNINNKKKIEKHINTIPCQTYGMYTTQGTYLNNTCSLNEPINNESNKISDTFDITTEATNKTDIDISSISVIKNKPKICEEFDINSYDTKGTHNSDIELISHVKKCKSCKYKVNNLVKHDNVKSYKILNHDFKEILIISLLGFLILLLVDLILNPK